MALNWALTNHAISDEREVLVADRATLASGMALSAAMQAGNVLNWNYPGNVGSVKYTDGTTTDALVGIALAPKKMYLTNFMIDQIVVPTTPYQVLLSHTALNPTTKIGATNVATGALLAVSGSGAGSTNVNAAVDSATGLTILTFDSTHVGVTFDVAYNYTMTEQDSERLYGQAYPGWSQLDQLGRTGVIRNGTVATNMLDPLAEWSASGATTTVKCIAGGLFTSSEGGLGTAAGFIPTNANIVSVPTYLMPWLILELTS